MAPATRVGGLNSMSRRRVFDPATNNCVAAPQPAPPLPPRPFRLYRCAPAYKPIPQLPIGGRSGNLGRLPDPPADTAISSWSRRTVRCQRPDLQMADWIRRSVRFVSGIESALAAGDVADDKRPVKGFGSSLLMGDFFFSHSRPRSVTFLAGFEPVLAADMAVSWSPPPTSSAVAGAGLSVCFVRSPPPTSVDGGSPSAAPNMVVDGSRLNVATLPPLRSGTAAIGEFNVLVSWAAAAGVTFTGRNCGRDERTRTAA